MAAPYTYKDKCNLEVRSADNRLTVLLNPDSGSKSATVYQYHSNGFGADPGVTLINLVPVLSALGGSANISVIGSNFKGGGSFRFAVNTDGDREPEQDWEVEETLPECTSKQWCARFEKLP